ncbi:MAG: hypothetical protein R3321_09925 [Nitrososphaeraceae archaeon]|nr:hypothetical protein [Nitrososphaeraceae archaeon]
MKVKPIKPSEENKITAREIKPTIILSEDKYAEACSNPNMKLNSLSHDRATGGDIIELRGIWGEFTSNKVPRITNIGERKLKVLEWSPDTIRVQIPYGLEEGEYKINVMCTKTIEPWTGVTQMPLKIQIYGSTGKNSEANEIDSEQPKVMNLDNTEPKRIPKTAKKKVPPEPCIPLDLKVCSRRIYSGMPEQDAITILGEPDESDTGGRTDWKKSIWKNKETGEFIDIQFMGNSVRIHVYGNYNINSGMVEGYEGRFGILPE